MKFTCDRKELSKILKNISIAAVQKATNLPVLEGVLLNLKDNTLKLSCYDLRIGMKTEMNVTGKENGDIVVGAEILSNMAQKMKGETLTFESGERNIVTVSSGRSKFKIVGMDAESFPDMPDFEQKDSFEGESEDIKKAFKGALIAASSDDVSKVTSGINCVVKENKLYVFAVNGILGVERSADVKGANCDFIIPGKECKNILKLIDNGDNVSFLVGEKHLMIKIGEYTIVTRLLDGRFPDIATMLNSKMSKKAIIDRKELKSALDCVTIVNVNARISTPIKTAFTENVVTLSMSAAMGQSEESCEADYNGEDIAIGLSPVYLTNAIDSLTSDELVFNMETDRSPVVIVSDKDNARILIAPMLLNR